MSKWQPLAIAVAALGPQCLASFGVFLGLGNMESAFSWALRESSGVSGVGIETMGVVVGEGLWHWAVPLSTIVVVKRKMKKTERAIQMKHCFNNLAFS